MFTFVLIYHIISLYLSYHDEQIQSISKVIVYNVYSRTY